MSLHPHPVHPSTPAPLQPPSVPPDADIRLGTIARVLHEVAVADPGPTDLVGVVDLAALGAEPEPGGRPDRLVLAALDDPDPVTLLLGRTAPAEFWAVGVITGARGRSLDGAARADDATLVHLVDRRGRSVSLFGAADTAPLAEGPDTRPGEGRTADACRRMLGLPTAPPPGDMTTHVIDVWLARVTRSALADPGLDWPAVVALNPALGPPLPCTPIPTPAEVARRTVELGEELDWGRYRLRCAEAGGTPFGELDGDVLDWMDAGMFARWMLGESVAWSVHLDLIDALLSPGAVDRLWATLALCPMPSWPPTRQSPITR